MSFKLSETFIHKYKSITPPFGFNGLGELTYMRTYSRVKANGKNERWHETIRRVVEGTYEIQRLHILSQGLFWDQTKALESAEEMYDRMFNMKFLPPGRGLWLMGTDVLKEKNLYAGLNSCAFISTKDIDVEPTKPFEFLMDMSMLGVGVGFDVKGEGKIVIKQIDSSCTYEIPDDREGWVISLRHLLEAFFIHGCLPEFDYSKIRAEGTPIRGFGGTSSGYKPLKYLHDSIYEMFKNRAGETITITDIVDIMNHIGVCVVAGNIRRTAEIVFGDHNNTEYMKLKDYAWDGEKFIGNSAHRSSFGWASNNSVFANIGDDYNAIAKQISVNGEPGIIWMENARKYSRMIDPPNWLDKKAEGTNPCFTGDMRLLTVHGYKRFDELGSDEYIIDDKGNSVPANVFKTGTKDTVSLIYMSGNKKQEIKCTPDHCFMDTEGLGIQAKDTKGSRLMPFYSIKPIQDRDYKYVTFGFVNGDGRTNPAKRQMYATAKFGVKDDDMKNIFSKVTYEEMEILGFDKRKLPERNLPSTFGLWNNEDQLNFLTGLYSANGSVVKGHRVSFKTSSPELVESLVFFLKKYGIETNITVNKPKRIKFPNGEYDCKESYGVEINRFESIKIFAEKIAFVHKYKRLALEQLILEKSPMIQHVVKGGSEDVYDFSMYSENHWGVVEGFVAHNCGEQTLEPYELCVLVETFPTMNDGLEDYLRTLKFAYLYAKTVTLCGTHWAETNRVMLRNRRIGTSMSGIAQFFDKFGINELKKMASAGYETIEHYDKIYSDYLCVPRSIKVTSVKPSGTVSLLPGVTPGVHFPESNLYIRRITIDKKSPLVDVCKNAGYEVEDSVYDINSVKVSVPVSIDGVRTINEVSMWEQLHLAATMQAYWADNQVSCTVTVKQDEIKDIPNALNYFQYHLKAISFLPKIKGGAYAQMPYEEIGIRKYVELSSKIKSLNFDDFCEDSKPEQFCDGQTCLLN